MLDAQCTFSLALQTLDPAQSCHPLGVTWLLPSALSPLKPSTYLDSVHHQASCHHAQARQQYGYGDLACGGEDGFREDTMRGAGELTAEASKFLALKAELKAELSDDHGWAPVESVLSLPCPPRLSLRRSKQTEAFQEAPQWVLDSPLAEGQSKKCQSGGCQCLLFIPLVRFSSARTVYLPGPPSASLPDRLTIPQQRP